MVPYPPPHHSRHPFGMARSIQAVPARRHAQVSRLAEHEVTRLISLVTAMAQRMGIEEADDPGLAELAQDIAPERVLDEIETNERKVSEATP